MTAPLQHDRFGNPEPPAGGPFLPPSERSRISLGLTAAAAIGRFALQVCRECRVWQYPPREMCGQCLSVLLDWEVQSGDGVLLCETALAHSTDPYFRERLPWRLGIVRLDCGPTAVVHLRADTPAAPAPVRVHAMLDRAGQGVLVAYPAMGTPDMLHDEQVREMTCDPKRRKILVTDGRSAVGQALVLALIVAQADQVWVGHAESTDLSRNLTELQTLPQVRVLPLDVTREESVKDAAATMGGQVDIVINTAELHYVQGGNLSSAQELAHAQMDVNYFGLLRLAQEFGPLMRSRAEKGQGNAVAWVNLLSVFALSSFPGRGEFSASKSAAHLFSQSLRAQMQPAGIRVVNVFPGPLDDEWNQNISLPKLGAAALAQAIVKSLREAVEDVYPGDVAQEWLARWRDNPKVLERELALGSRPV